MSGAPSAEKDALTMIRDLLPDICWVTRNDIMVCTDFIGGTLGDKGTFTEAMCCLPCRIRVVLTSVTSPEVTRP